MKKREVKAFDIKTFETKEEVVAEIKRLEQLKRKKGKQLAKTEDFCSASCIIGIAAAFLSVLVTIGSAFALFGYNKELSNTANIISSMDEFEEIQQKDITSLTEKLNDGKISNKEFDNEYKNLNSYEYIRSVAPKFCEQEIIDKYDSAEKSYNIAKSVIKTAGGIMALGGLTTVGSFVTYETKAEKYDTLYKNTQEQLNLLYNKNKELKENES